MCILEWPLLKWVLIVIDLLASLVVIPGLVAHVVSRLLSLHLLARREAFGAPAVAGSEVTEASCSQEADCQGRLQASCRLLHSASASQGKPGRKSKGRPGKGRPGKGRVYSLSGSRQGTAMLSKGEPLPHGLVVVCPITQPHFEVVLTVNHGQPSVVPQPPLADDGLGAWLLGLVCVASQRHSSQANAARCERQAC